ncbi:HTH domain-containing protein [Chitinophaga agrisoli]|uniref:HTH domain-containing protein n=1 Tax=Chitinophaga agrisoli TaxID=2607653 RepID=A0A5B2VNL3_9BACT|nr:HTH domain-containing protein [Chitinophaga agrisoli]
MTRDALSRLQRIDYLIQIKGTGTPAQLAQKLGMSKRSIFDYLNLMKEFGAPIKFCNFRQSYYYDEDGSFKITFAFKRSMSEYAK